MTTAAISKTPRWPDEQAFDSRSFPEQSQDIYAGDFNVPLDETAASPTTRASASTSHHRVRAASRRTLILASHLGRPKGKPNPKMSLRPVAERLRMLLDNVSSRGENVGFCPIASACRPRRWRASWSRGRPCCSRTCASTPEEEATTQRSPGTREARRLYVNDAFGIAHRAHASTEGITKFVEQPAAGLLMEKELEYLGKALSIPQRPFVAILGGARSATRSTSSRT